MQRFQAWEDMTLPTLGLDRGSTLIAAGLDERDPAVKHRPSLAIAARRHMDATAAGLCGIIPRP